MPPGKSVWKYLTLPFSAPNRIDNSAVTILMTGCLLLFFIRCAQIRQNVQVFFSQDKLFIGSKPVS
jgi:hypothetical protein